MGKIYLFISIFLILTLNSFSQEEGKKFWVSGTARGAIFMDQITGIDQDTVTPKKVNGGHTLVDLAANLRPNSVTFIKAAVRIRNEYGGFWGSGITFDLRELYIKGLIAKSIRYQIGDLNYKLTPFTFYNNEEETYRYTPEVFGIYNEMLHYDLFYNDKNTWRQQGLAIDFALTFKKYVEELQFNFFSTRLNPTDFSFKDERIFAGGNITLVQSKYLTIGGNYVNLLDIGGTSKDTVLYRNPVISGTYVITIPLNKWDIKISGESGISDTRCVNDNEAPELNDYFHMANVSASYNPFFLEVQAGYRNIGPQFRSPGAQMKRINFGMEPIAYTRYTNEQILRPIGLWDIIHDESIYNTQISTGLQAYNPKYDNIEPYGVSTPNRKGFNFAVVKSDKKERYRASLGYNILSEIVGQGTDALRKFNMLDADVELRINNMIPSMERNFFIQLSYNDGRTKRSGQEAFEEVDLKTRRICAGITWEFVKDFELLAGLQMLTAEGSELIPERDSYDEIVDFSEFKTNLNEQLYGAGLQYYFTSKINLQFLYEYYQWEDQKAIEPKYGFQRFALIFNMKF